jgi:class 3 adenylate cyclase
MVAELRDKRRIEEDFGRHVGERVARKILERAGGLGGAEEELTIMFVDIRNFTARAEASSPEQAVALLNVFLTEMVDVIEQRHGIVNKFLGDGLMAMFAAWTGRLDHADAAVAAGREMHERLQRINARLADAGEPPLALGIGIHTGRAVVGSIGAPRRMEYTAIGDTVNVASLVEDITGFVKYSSRLKTALAPHVCALLAQGVSVVLDFPGNTRTQRAWFRRIFERAKVEHELHFVDASDAVCKSQLRERSAPLAPGAPWTTEAELEAITVYFEPPSEDEGLNVIRHER